MEILTKENLVGAKLLTKGNQVSLVVRIHFAHPESDGKSVSVKEEGRGTRNGCEASKGSKGVSDL